MSMKMKAFVIIEVATGKEKQVTANLAALAGVKSADSVTGPYDVIAIIEGKDLTDIGDLITGKIVRIEGIKRTLTCLAVQPV